MQRGEQKRLCINLPDKASLLRHFADICPPHEPGDDVVLGNPCTIMAELEGVMLSVELIDGADAYPGCLEALSLATRIVAASQFAPTCFLTNPDIVLPLDDIAREPQFFACLRPTRND